METKEYIRPEIMVVAVEEQLLAAFTQWNVDNTKGGDVKEEDDGELGWGMSD